MVKSKRVSALKNELRQKLGMKKGRAECIKMKKPNSVTDNGEFEGADESVGKKKKN